MIFEEKPCNNLFILCSKPERWSKIHVIAIWCKWDKFVTKDNWYETLPLNLQDENDNWVKLVREKMEDGILLSKFDKEGGLKKEN